MNYGIEEFPLTTSAIKLGISSGLHTCAQVCINQYGENIASFAIGEFEPGRVCTENTVMPWMSCSKMVTALAFGILVDRGIASFSIKAGEIIPEFACNGKDEITFRDILNHTAGIRVLSAKWDHLTWDEAIDAVCKMPVENNWRIGADGGYHVGTSWFILGEAVQRLSGLTLQEFVSKEIFHPLGMNTSWLSIPDEIYNDPKQEIARFYRTDCSPPRAALDKYANAPNKCRPGASGRGPLKELARFIEMLYEGGCLGTTRIISEQTLEEMIRPSRIGVIDQTFGKIIDWGLGFMIDSKQYQHEYPYSFGPGASGETFGHNGNQSSAAYVDPEEELVICFAFNGLPGEAKHQKRLQELNSAIYADLKII